MAITLTEKAATEVKRVIEQSQVEPDTFLRIGVAGGGCSGMNYSLQFDKGFDQQKDNQYDCHGIKIVIDKKSSLLLDGTTVDWYDSVGRSGFTFDNPNAVKTCACGGH